MTAEDFRSGGTYHNLPTADDVVVNLPANPAAGTTVAVASTIDTRFVTVAPDGQDTILLSGKSIGDLLRVDTAGANVELVANGANGWVVTSIGGVWI